MGPLHLSHQWAAGQLPDSPQGYELATSPFPNFPTLEGSCEFVLGSVCNNSSSTVDFAAYSVS